jgi:hypothetical protein
LAPARRDLLTDVLQNHVAGYCIEDDLASGRQEWEAVLDLADQIFAAQAR